MATSVSNSATNQVLLPNRTRSVGKKNLPATLIVESSAAQASKPAFSVQAIFKECCQLSMQTLIDKIDSRYKAHVPSLFDSLRNYAYCGNRRPFLFGVEWLGKKYIYDRISDPCCDDKLIRNIFLHYSITIHDFYLIQGHLCGGSSNQIELQNRRMKTLEALSFLRGKLLELRDALESKSGMKSKAAQVKQQQKLSGVNELFTLISFLETLIREEQESLLYDESWKLFKAPNQLLNHIQILQELIPLYLLHFNETLWNDGKTFLGQVYENKKFSSFFTKTQPHFDLIRRKSKDLTDQDISQIGRAAHAVNSSVEEFSPKIDTENNHIYYMYTNILGLTQIHQIFLTNLNLARLKSTLTRGIVTYEICQSIDKELNIIELITPLFLEEEPWDDLLQEHLSNLENFENWLKIFKEKLILPLKQEVSTWKNDPDKQAYIKEFLNRINSPGVINYDTLDPVTFKFLFDETFLVIAPRLARLIEEVEINSDEITLEIEQAYTSGQIPLSTYRRLKRTESAIRFWMNAAFRTPSNQFRQHLIFLDTVTGFTFNFFDPIEEEPEEEHTEIKKSQIKKVKQRVPVLQIEKSDKQELSQKEGSDHSSDTEIFELNPTAQTEELTQSENPKADEIEIEENDKTETNEDKSKLDEELNQTAIENLEESPTTTIPVPEPEEMDEISLCGRNRKLRNILKQLNKMKCTLSTRKGGSHQTVVNPQGVHFTLPHHRTLKKGTAHSLRAKATDQK